jgi:uncharacterized protein Yka (UPF0111/DUF47 family)
VTAQEVNNQIAEVEAEIDSIGDEGLVKLMKSCTASKEQIKKNYGKGVDASVKDDIDQSIDLMYLATIRNIQDLAKDRNLL